MSGKTHKGLQKRLKRTGTGKLMRRRPGKSHLMSCKSGKRKRRLDRWVRFSDMDTRLFERQFGKLL
jgi:large subunit ribosomal protein L35